MNFDLNIDNYTRDELIEMFELPYDFDKNIVEIKESKIIDKINNNKELNKHSQMKTIEFLIKAKNIILNTNSTENISLKKNFEELHNYNYELKTSKLEEQGEHVVQVRPNKPHISSYPSEFFQGVINPIKKRTIKKNLNIDTRFRDNYYYSSSSNFNLNLPININDVLQMQLASIEVPTTYYVISKHYGNNFFTIVVNGSSTVVTIPDGNFDQLAIMTQINNQLNSRGTPFNGVSFTVNLEGINIGSGQTIVGVNIIGSGTITDIELNFQADKFGNEDRNTPLPLKFGWLLGFRNGIYVGNLNYVSESVVDIIGPKYIYLVVDDYNNSVNNSFYSAFNSSILNKNILARISIQSNNFNILSENNLVIISTPREYFGPVNIQTMNIQLLDEYGRILDLNNMDFSFCLTLTTVYDL